MYYDKVLSYNYLPHLKKQGRCTIKNRAFRKDLKKMGTSWGVKSKTKSSRTEDERVQLICP